MRERILGAVELVGRAWLARGVVAFALAVAWSFATAEAFDRRLLYVEGVHVPESIEVSVEGVPSNLSVTIDGDLSLGGYVGTQ